jgi:ABC-type antimicrobial peptide transport system permease subunit
MSNNFISINGAPPSDVLAFFLHVSPGWMETMKIPFLAGRDLRAPDADTGAAIVNQTFAREYFRGENPIGHSFETTWPARTRFQIVGLVGDASYRNLREAMLPVVYVPFDARPMGTATYVVRTAGANPLALASILRSEVPRARSEFSVSNIRTQKEIDDAQTVRERLLARLALFFAAVALLLAGIGLYGVLNYFVVERRREIGIRIAIGAPAADIVRRVTAETLGTVLVGMAGGATLGLMSAPYIEALLFQVKPTGAPATALPALMMTAVALLAALPAVVRAVHIDPAGMLRED